MSKQKEKNDKKIFMKWVIIMVFAFLGGTLIGGFGKIIHAKLVELFSNVNLNSVQVAIPLLIVFALMNIVVLLVGFYQYVAAKKLVQNVGDEDEEVLEIAEKKLDMAMIPSTIMNGVNYFFFALVMYVCNYGDENPDLQLLLLGLVGVVIFMGSMFVTVALQKKAVDLIKKLNPEKKGNIFDKDFAKDWEASCDEAQKQMIYKSGYASYKATNLVGQVLWILTILGMMFFDTGLFPVFCVTVIMLTLMISYSATAFKLEYGTK